MFDWIRKWRRRRSPVVQVQTHEFYFPPTDESLFSAELIGAYPDSSVVFCNTDVPHHMTAKLKEDGTLTVTRVGAASEAVEATVTVVEFAK